MKNSKSRNELRQHTSAPMITIGVLYLLIMAGAIAGTWQYQTARSYERWQEKKDALMQGYLQTHAERSDWWLHRPYTPTPATVNIITEKSAELEAIVARYAATDPPLSQEIAAAFAKINASMFTNGSSLSFSANYDPAQSMTENYGFEVCFIARAEFKDRRFPGNLYYNAPWHAVMITGLEWPPTVLAGVLYHELGHALRHREGADSAQAPAFSAEWVGEEIRMHRLEHAVFDAATDGAYTAALQSILEKHQPIDALTAAICATPQDFAALDAVVGATDAGSDVASVLAFQYSLSLAQCFADDCARGGDTNANDILAEIYLRYAQPQM